jgi:glyoxylase I family protein
MTDLSSDDTTMLAQRFARHGNNKVRRLHHHAIRTKDMAMTRHFYEDLLGLPLVGTWKEGFDPKLNRPSPYLHCFFELGDGSALAFFYFAPGGRADPPLMPQDGLDHHIALAVDSFDVVTEMKQRLDAHGYPCALMDHGYCYSLYMRDPNGMLVEIAGDPPDGVRITEEAAAHARAELKKWEAGDYSINNTYRNNNGLPTSRPEELLSIVFPRTQIE